MVLDNIQIFERQDDEVSCVSFSPNDKFICCESDDSQIVLCDLDDKVFGVLSGHEVISS